MIDKNRNPEEETSNDLSMDIETLMNIGEDVRSREQGGPGRRNHERQSRRTHKSNGQGIASRFHPNAKLSALLVVVVAVVGDAIGVVAGSNNGGGTGRVGDVLSPWWLWCGC